MYDATAADLQNTAAEWLTDGDYTLEVLPFPDVNASDKGVDRSTFPATEEPPLARFPEVQRIQLSNGLKVVLAEVHSIPLVVFSMLTDAGYAADAGDMAGLSRLTSDLMDEGTNKRTGSELSDELNILGARITTGASLDNSYVALSTLKQNLDPSCALFAEVILTPSFTASDFNRIQKLQINRIKRDKIVPSSIATRVYPKVLYGEEHPYGNPWNGCGFEETVAKVTLNDVRDFHKKWFLPNNSTLIVVGDITMDEILPRLEKLFGAWKKGQIPGKQVPAVAPGQKPAVYIVDKPEAPQSEVFAGFLAPSPKDNGTIAMDIMNKIFGSEAGARLFMNIREDKHWSYGAYSFFNDVAGQRPFMMWAPVQTDKTKETMQEILKEVKGIIGDKPVTQDEFSHASLQDCGNPCGRLKDHLNKSSTMDFRIIISANIPA
ncbi:MAG: pitrilysin family protein [Bacteroidetes bacterium]|nr:pitrilysin family protein [Bacteroidota bacterium]